MDYKEVSALYKTLKNERLLSLTNIKKALMIYHHFGLKHLYDRVTLLLKSRKIKGDTEVITDHTLEKILTNAKTLTNHLTPPAHVVVDIIIPVYRGLAQTQKCISSVLSTSSLNIVKHRIIIINDASPENEVTQYLRTLPQREEIILIENENNLGFTATVNKGMQLSDFHDVILLNSDTEVANNWLDKLTFHAYGQNTIGTVTPFSNNATICSYPTIYGMDKLPEGETTETLDIACEEANTHKSLELPTAVGFCMYIRKACLKDVGLFDVETYGKGYGEENDFCVRATLKGWKHLLAADTFVYHEGEASFQEESAERKKHALNTLRRLYPDYERDIMAHIAKNEVYVYRLSVTIARFKQNHKPVLLYISHNLGGGTEKHVAALCEAKKAEFNILVMNPMDEKTVKLYSANNKDAFSVQIPVINKGLMISFLKMFNIKLAHIHHTLGYTFSLKYIIDSLQLPFYFTAHDYYAVCPRISFMRPKDKTYCGEPDKASCNRCLAMDNNHSATTITDWRNSNAWLFNEAKKVICPTMDVAKRYKRYYPNANYRIVPHEPFTKRTDSAINIMKIYSSEPLVVLLIGAIGEPKGFDLLKNSVMITEKYNFPLQFNLIGYTAEKISCRTQTFSYTGPYKDEELMDKITAVSPHLILFTSITPETYCYTLTTAINSDFPIMAPNIGAFPERLSNRTWTWLYDANTSPMALVDSLCNIRDTYFKNNITPMNTPYISGSENYEENFYLDSYVQ